jgi:hypothetical protein
MAKKLETGFPFRIVDIRVDEFSMSSSDVEFTDNELSIDFEPIIGYNLKETTVLIGFNVKYSLPNKTPLLNSKCSIIFEFTDEKDFLNFPEEGEPLLKNDIISSILGITISTVRGILYEKTKGSELQKVLIPIINPKEIIEHEFGEK